MTLSVMSKEDSELLRRLVTDDKPCSGCGGEWQYVATVGGEPHIYRFHRKCPLKLSDTHDLVVVHRVC